MSIFQSCSLNLSRNQYFVIGILIGFLYSYYLPEDLKDIATECPDVTEKGRSLEEKYGSEFEPQLNLEQKPMIAKKAVKNIVRPRYYYTELGIREKLFVGVMTEQENIDTLATAINKTSAHLVSKIKFFINADNVKSNFKLKNIVGFTDTRENLRPFHVLKYIADNYLDDYDYFLLVSDTGYLNARLLKEKLYHISISFDVYLGTKMSDSDEDERPNKEYCDLHAGIIMSSSVIRKIRTNLDWCVRNSASNQHSLNIGKCVKYSSKIDACQPSWQGVNITSYKLNSYKVYRDLHLIQKDKKFNEASIVYPVTNPDDYYLLHAYFSRMHLESINKEKLNIEVDSSSISNGTLTNDILEVRWPLGVPKPNPPETRHDIITWTHLNLTHSFMWDAENNAKKLSNVDAKDIQNILNKTILEAQKNNPNLRFDNLHSAYRKFDPVRGMDYKLHLNFVDRKTNQISLKTFEVVKPLGLIEIIPSPYVTESTRVAVLLPTFEHQLQEAINFIKSYEKVCMENQDNTFLMLVLLYKAATPSKGDEDVFLPLKNMALSLSDKYKTDGSRIAWVSIRLPQEASQDFDPNDLYLNTNYGKHEILSFAATDLALRKIGLESLVMICSNSMVFRADFLNRVRMNTIQGFQIFSPIGFMMYPCEWTNMCKMCETCDVGQSTGYFDRNNFDVVSFYSHDYVEARKKLEHLVPIVRSDKDIINLLNRSDSDAINNIMDMFVKSGLQIHVLRAIEPNLRYGEAMRNYLMKSHPDANVEDPLNMRCQAANAAKCVRIASKKHFGEAVVQYDNDLKN